MDHDTPFGIYELQLVTTKYPVEVGNCEREAYLKTVTYLENEDSLIDFLRFSGAEKQISLGKQCISGSYTLHKYVVTGKNTWQCNNLG